MCLSSSNSQLDMSTLKFNAKSMQSSVECTLYPLGSVALLWPTSGSSPSCSHYPITLQSWTIHLLTVHKKNYFDSSFNPKQLQGYIRHKCEWLKLIETVSTFSHLVFLFFVLFYHFRATPIF
jgi:hypothetical protein